MKNNSNKKSIIGVFGDSHAEVFDYINKAKLSDKVVFDVIWIGGATAQGMVNPNSLTNSLEIFINKIQNIEDKKTPLIFLLGEVDTGFVIWYRAAKFNETVGHQLKRSIDNYFAFIEEVLNLGFKDITIMSAPPPTIKDNQDWGEIANLRREIKATQLERSVLTRQYNNLLSIEVSKRNLKMLNFDEILYDQTGIVKSYFLNTDPNNHHLDNAKYSKIILPEIERAFSYKGSHKSKYFSLLFYYNGFRNLLRNYLILFRKDGYKRFLEQRLKNKYLPVNNQRIEVVDSSKQPIWVIGMFRSGSSLTSNILLKLGADFGNERHFLLAKGALKEINPNGFFENFIFAEYSRFLLNEVGAWGDNPPEAEKTESIRLEQVNLSRMIDFSFYKINDDRITNRNKYNAFKSLLKNGLSGYFRIEFHSDKPYVKIPMLAFFTDALKAHWPNSRFLVVFRNPVSTLISSKAVFGEIEPGLYNRYYDRLMKLKEKGENIIFFSYDRLLEDPEKSISVLTREFGLNKEAMGLAAKMIDPALFRSKPTSVREEIPKEVITLHERMLKIAINS